MEIRIHDLRSFEEIQVVRTMNHWVYSIFVDRNQLFCGAHSMIKVFAIDGEAFTELETIKPTQGKSIFCLMATDQYLLSATWDKTIDGPYP